MNSWPITDEVPVVDSAGQCALCDEIFPFVNVLTCRRLKGGDVPVCLTCHQRIHPACTLAQSVLASSHFECQLCASTHPVLVCALCSVGDSKDEILDGVLMCQSCSDTIHTPGKHHHRDHFYPVASPTVIAVRGPVHWHNYVDVCCELAQPNLTQPRATQAPPPPCSQPIPCHFPSVMPVARAPSSANQQPERIVKAGSGGGGGGGGSSDVRSVSIGVGSSTPSGPSLAIRKKVITTSTHFDRYSKLV